MSFSRTARRVVGLALVVFSLAACSGGDGGSASGDDPAPAAGGAFPVSIPHKFGATEVKAEPQRIVVVGLVEQDALLSLGVVPVATTEWFGEYPGAIWPWAKDKLGDAKVPEVLKDKDGIQYERIAALAPDLIIGLYSGLNDESYKKLTEIAPTIAQPKGAPDYGSAWQDVTTTVGAAVGKSQQAKELVAGVEAHFAKIKAEHPEFAGKTGLVATPYEGYFVYGTKDPRSRVMASLGFKLPAKLDSVIGDQFGGSLSKERIDLVDVDALVWFVEPGKADELRKDPVYKGLKVRKEGRDVMIDADNKDPFYGATNFVSVLSLPMVLDGLAPQLKAALDGNPATNG